MKLGRHSSRWKELLQLDKAKARRDSGLFLVEGPKLLAEALRGRHRLCEVVYDPRRWQPPADLGVPTWEVEPEMLQRLGDAQHSQGVIGVAASTSWLDWGEARRLVIADGLSDPGNLGSLLRVIRATGLDGLLCLGGADPFQPKVVRASAGAIFHVPCRRLEELPNLGRWKLVGLAPRGGEDLFRMEWPERWALAVGNEAHGLSSALESRLDRLCTIPMEPGCESLNAAVSAAVVLYRWYAGSKG